MSFRELSLREASINQLKFKYEANKTMFLTLFVIQILFLFIAASGTSHMTRILSGITVSKQIYSADGVIMMSILWSAVIALGLVSMRDMDFTLVSNRLSGHISNWLLLGGMALYAGITAAMMGPLLRLAAYLYYGKQVIAGGNFLISPAELAMSILVVSLYNGLAMAIAYTYGMLGQRFHPLYFLLPMLVMGLFYLELSYYNQYAPLGKIFEFYIESNLLLFVTKATLTIGVLMIFCHWLGKRLEVRL